MLRLSAAMRSASALAAASCSASMRSASRRCASAVQQPGVPVRLLEREAVALLLFSRVRSASALAAASCSASMRSFRRCASARSAAWRSISAFRTKPLRFCFQQRAVSFCFGGNKLFGLVRSASRRCVLPVELPVSVLNFQSKGVALLLFRSNALSFCFGRGELFSLDALGFDVVLRVQQPGALVRLSEQRR